MKINFKIHLLALFLLITGPSQDIYSQYRVLILKPENFSKPLLNANSTTLERILKQSPTFKYNAKFIYMHEDNELDYNTNPTAPAYREMDYIIKEILTESNKNPSFTICTFEIHYKKYPLIKINPIQRLINFNDPQDLRRKTEMLLVDFINLQNNGAKYFIISDFSQEKGCSKVDLQNQIINTLKQFSFEHSITFIPDANNDNIEPKSLNAKSINSKLIFFNGPSGVNKNEFQNFLTLPLKRNYLRTPEYIKLISELKIKLCDMLHVNLY